MTFGIGFPTQSRPSTALIPSPPMTDFKVDGEHHERPVDAHRFTQRRIAGIRRPRRAWDHSIVEFHLVENRRTQCQHCVVIVFPLFLIDFLVKNMLNLSPASLQLPFQDFKFHSVEVGGAAGAAHQFEKVRHFLTLRGKHGSTR